MELLSLTDPPEEIRSWKCWTCNDAGEAPYPPGGWAQHNRSRRHRAAAVQFSLREIRKHLGFLLDALVGR